MRPVASPSTTSPVAIAHRPPIHGQPAVGPSVHHAGPPRRRRKATRTATASAPGIPTGRRDRDVRRPPNDAVRLPPELAEKPTPWGWADLRQFVRDDDIASPPPPPGGSTATSPGPVSAHRAAR